MRYMTFVFAMMISVNIVKAEDSAVGITAEIMSVTVETPQGPVEIERIQTTKTR